MSVARSAILASMANSVSSQENSSTSTLLPPEILSQIFLEVDPHTLYTSIRALSRGWKQCVEDRLMAAEFESGRWRVGLRVVRKPKMGAPWRGGRAGSREADAPGSNWNEVRSRVSQRAQQQGLNEEQLVQEARHAFATYVAAQSGSLEDELEPALSGQGSTYDHGAPVLHTIPMQFKRYDKASTTLQFNTPNEELHALFEKESSRLDLDFGIIWRFPGDGQDDAEEWGDADPENGWLSRFYCSSFDTKKIEDSDAASKKLSEPLKLRSTPLARRVRRAITRADSNEEGDEDDTGETSVDPSAPLEWDDRGHEYAALSLSLGTEFFVRRSARANHLLRRLEAEVESARKARKQAKKKRSKMQSTLSSQCSTPYLRSPNRALMAVDASSSSSLEVPALRLHQSLTTLDSTRASTPSTGSVCSSGTCTPSTSNTPAWKLDRSASYAAIASTPPSNPQSRRGSSSSSGTRILRPVLFGTPKESVAPLPSVNASGYTSVQHQSLADGKEEEMKAEKEEYMTGDVSMSSEEDSFDSGSMTRSSSSKGYASKVAISSHHSVPRCHFSARLVRIGSQAKEWQGGDSYGRNAVRQAVLPAKTSVAIWEWCR
ncbi:uncharacterized protein FA14DRAFT_160491 [Meira miltonrushii]|uniref:F-box domain-containing protein n=1 Tax=Meira miltonrushii TaxID=1280837 RepID=A0A316VC76_9BASI|nr:uncharacterized protein FA14DRAFT_160491 [Meira miltonrushii]PWN35267.1 hypothetical protein FA14DRAFT_160491 [Meira miltonrushii]